MAKKNPDVDSYIAKAKPFAKPILKKLRTSVHKSCPTVSEEIKWGAPFFVYQGRVLCAIMGFKAHAALIFWKSGLIKKKGKAAQADLKQLRRLASLDDLIAEKKLAEYLKLAMHLNEPTTKLPPREKRAIPVKTPAAFLLSLRANPRALKNFNAFTPSKKKDYIFWISSAKTEATREKRLETSVDWISEGKSRNWKYELNVKKKAR